MGLVKWAFYGPDALKTAEHYASHVTEFLNRHSWPPGKHQIYAHDPHTYVLEWFLENRDQVAGLAQTLKGRQFHDEEWISKDKS